MCVCVCIAFRDCYYVTEDFTDHLNKDKKEVKENHLHINQKPVPIWPSSIPHEGPLLSHSVFISELLGGKSCPYNLKYPLQC